MDEFTTQYLKEHPDYVVINAKLPSWTINGLDELQELTKQFSEISEKLKSVKLQITPNQSTSLE